ncbi:flippase [Mesobacillus harenae]|uniref:flippase n=1 Tax=Mesobacillus harenae TaxID=2213203 RepID=UPI0015809A0D|nr:flippase [Mesobacillus harenae]
MKKNSIIINAVYLFSGNVLVRFLTAASTILIARYLGAEDYGILSIALAYAAVAAYFTDLGLTHTLIREGTKEQTSIPVLMSSFFRIRMVLSLATILLSVLIIEGLYEDPYLKRILYIVLIPTIIGAALQGVGAAYYQMIEKMHLTALIRAIAGFTTAAALIAGIIFKWPLLYIAPVYGLANITAGLFSLFIVIRNVNIFKGWDKSLLQGLFSFTISGLTIMLLPQIGPIIIERASDLKEAGYFSAAYRIPALLYQIPGVVAAAFYPVLFRLGNNKEFDQHLDLNRKQLKTMSFLGIAMAIPFLYYADWWISFLFGNEWQSAALPLSILAFVVILQSFNYPMADALTTTGRQTIRTYIQSAALLIGIALYYVLSSRFGSTGGAIAAVTIELMLFTGFAIFQGKNFVSLMLSSSKVLIAFAGTSILFITVGSRVHPFIGSIALDLLFIMFILMVDTDIRREVIKRIASITSKRKRGVK